MFSAVDGSPSPLPTTLRLASIGGRLVALFRSEASRLSPTGAAHDDDLWTGDVVELFVAPDDADRSRYFEIEVNPDGLVFDARISFPGPDRRTMTADRSWNPPGLSARSRVRPLAPGRLAWLVRLSIPWSELLGKDAPAGPVAVGAFRIDRASRAAPLFLALAPSRESPPNFHVPAALVRWDPRRDPVFPAPLRG